MENIEKRLSLIWVGWAAGVAVSCSAACDGGLDQRVCLQKVEKHICFSYRFRC
jgi:hypothetical protein